MNYDRSDPCVWFERTAGRAFASAISHYTKILMERLVPIFDDLDGEMERAADGVMKSRGSRGEGDFDDAVEAAYQHAQDHVIEFMELRGVFLATGVAGLFHLFEKQVYRHLNHELRESLSEPIACWRDAAEIVHRLDHHDGNGPNALHAAFNDRELRELQLVANAVKHAADGHGRSFEELKRMNAAVVQTDRLDWTVGPLSVLGVPLVIQAADVERYKAAILRFWAIEGKFWCKVPPEPGVQVA